MTPILLTTGGNRLVLLDADCIVCTQWIDWQGVPGCSTQVPLSAGYPVMVSEEPKEIAEIIQRAKEA